MHAMTLEEFAGHCKVDVVDGILTASCIVCDGDGQCHKLTKTVDLRPAVNYVATRLHAWHRAQHEAGVETHGFFDDVANYAKKAVSVVSDVAHNKTVQALYNKAAPFIEQAVRKNVPGGDTVMDIATKAHDLYNRAKQDHPDAVAAVKKLVGIAETGHPDAAETIKAKFAVNVMKQVSAMTQAKAQGIPAHLATPPAPNEHMHVRDHRHGLYNLGVTTTSGYEGHYDIVGFGGMDDMMRRHLTNQAISRAKAGPARRGGVADHRANPGGWQSQRGFRTPAFSAPPQRMFAPPPEVAQYQAQEAGYHPGPDAGHSYGRDDGGGDDGGGDDGGDDQVQGRFWSHPYRKTSQRIVDMRDHAGLGLAARELYNRGLGRGKTEWTDVAAEALGHL